jgi:7-cyano-7-deazaguanine synthase in queuosine biosynthesis
MNALSPTRLLRVGEDASAGVDQVAVLGRDIRTSPEKIAQYCITLHEPIYEDLATLVEGMAFWDRRIVRRRAEGWSRDLSIQVPVFENSQFQRSVVVEALAEAAWFLTGDRWNFEFVARKGSAPSRQGTLGLRQGSMAHVVSFSDGLDSFAQAQLSVQQHGRDAVMLVRSGLGQDRVLQNLVCLRVPRKFGGGRMREVSYRTRPLVFYTLAAIGAAVTGAEAVVIGENGQGAIGPACLPFADEWWFRSAHPAFVQRWAHCLTIILGKAVRFEQPQLWNTKGEVLSTLRVEGLLAGWESTSSCSTRPNDRYGHHGCGICGGCLLRTVSARSAGLSLPTRDNAFDVYGSDDITHDRDGRERRLTSSERAVAVRAVAAMSEFADLADSPNVAAVVQREADLIDSTNSKAIQANLLRLLRQHRAEWHAFVNSLPKRSWVSEIVGQL